MHDADAVAQAAGRCVAGYGVSVVRVPPHDDERQVVGQIVEGLDGQQDILTLLDAADAQDVALVVSAWRDREAEPRRTTLVDNRDAALVDLSQLYDVAPGTFADGNDVVGLADSLAELPGVDLGVEPVIVFGVPQEDKVVDGHHAPDAALPDAYGQFAGEAVIEHDAVALQILDDAPRPP